MKRKLFALSVLMLIFLGACTNQKAKKGAADKPENDSILTMKNYYPGGGLKSIQTGKKVEKNGKTQYVMEGKCTEYYKTPKNALASKATYKNGKRDGMFYKYYTNGKLYYEVPYAEGKMEGLKKMYYEDGKVMSEVPYKKGLIGIGTKEYTSKGVELKDQMSIKVWYKKTGSGITVYAKAFNDGKLTKRAEFFEGFLIESKYYHKNLHEMKMGSDGVAKIEISSPMSYIVVSAKIRSARNVYHFVSQGINVK